MAAVMMVVAPHPDDAELGMGGTIAAMITSGSRVIVVDLSDGEPTPHGSLEIRARETAAASKVLGITDRIQLGLKNREIFDTVENRKLLASKIREYKPTILFAPYWDDAHPDHIEACKLVEGARFYSKFVKGDLAGEPHYPRKLLHFFSTHIRPRFEPAFVFDINNTIDQKMKSIECYESQFKHNPKNAEIIDAIRGEASYWGRQVQSSFGEPFVCRESIRLANVSTLTEL